ncbi:MAG: cyclic nucleotide-binding domain-containing protein [Desulfobacteraceae bacterium]|jgi:CRP-like cAMP-binding protein/SAM-dependent methyltransferase
MPMNESSLVDDPLVAPDLVQAVLPYAKTEQCGKGQDLILTGEQADCFYYVEEGTFEVSYTAQNTHIVVAMIGEGSFFGEIGFFDQLTRTRNIQAMEAASLRVFNQQSMAEISRCDARLYARFIEFLLRTVCSRFRQNLSDRGPLTSYAAFLSTGKEHFQGLQPLPADLLSSSGWRQVSQRVEDLKAALFDIAYQLQKDTGSDIDPDLLSRGEAVLDTFNSELAQFIQHSLAPQHVSWMWGYVFKEVFPYFMRSRYAERAYYKPKGYAGDYLMMEWIYKQQPDGDGKLGKLIDGWILRQASCQAVRNRRELLSDLLDSMCRQRLHMDRRIRIMNLACGPARELFDLLDRCDYSRQIDALCVDIDPEALQYANQHVNTSSHQASVRFMRENVIKWSIGRAKHDIKPQDIIYSSGLCDYLDQRMLTKLIRRCYDQLAPGGRLIIGNFAHTNPDRLLMDHIVYWRLIHRDKQDLFDAFSETPFGDRLEVITEAQGVNLFAVGTKKDL